MGRAARDFVDFLADGGQSCWQLLPIGHTSYGNSPYQAFSSYAGNPYFIDLDELAAQDLLLPEEYRNLDWGNDPARVDYARQYQNRYSVLRLACRRLWTREGERVAQFSRENVQWLPDYALFMALKRSHGGVSWQEWPEEERLRHPAALEHARQELAAETEFWSCVQYLFFRQWDALKK